MDAFSGGYAFGLGQAIGVQDVLQFAPHLNIQFR
jgi:hypothetical protein